MAARKLVMRKLPSRYYEICSVVLHLMTQLNCQSVKDSENRQIIDYNDTNYVSVCHQYTVIHNHEKCEPGNPHQVKADRKLVMRKLPTPLL